MSRRTFIIGFAFCLLSGTLRAAEVESLISSRETYVGVPVVLQIRVDNASSHQPPSIPHVDGLTIESAGAPSTRSQTSISIGPGGRRQTTVESTIYSFRVTPQREGSFTIPPIKVVADGLSTITKAARIVASKSETTDLLFVEVAGKEQEIFVGEALDLTLRIWIRPYRNQEYQVALGEANMWQLISSDSNWGYFQESLDELAGERRRPAGRPVLREDSTGSEREYLLYELEATVYPDRPGQIDADDIRLIVDYPLELGKARSRLSIFEDDFFRGSGLSDDSFFRGFGSRLGITKSRPIVAEATFEPINIKPIPEPGRPDDYRGAVGQYSIITEAKPASVKVGDPVTLHIRINGTGPMDRVLAPPLASQQNLIKDFKVPDEPLPGFVDRDRKVFRTTIRPQHEGVTQIPPITMSYFDPERAEFVSVASDPIPLAVEAADQLALDAIVGRQPAEIATPGDTQAATLDPAAGLTLFAGDELLQSIERPAIFSTNFLSWMVVPPIVAMTLLVFSSRQLFGGLVSARRRFQQSLASAQMAAEVGAALEHYLTRRFRLTESRLTRDQTVGRLRASGDHELAIRTERLYASCEKAMYVVSGHESVESLKDEARGIVADLKRRSSCSTPPARLGQTSSNSTIMIVVLIAVLQSLPAVAADNKWTLSADQQRQLLSEALSTYAAATQRSDSAEARLEFARSADKFQLLVDSGLWNDRLHFNLAAARLRAGQTGYAIASLRRALRLRPENQLYRETLMLAQNRLPESRVESALTLTAVNDFCLRFVSPRAIKGLLVSAWFTFWGIVALRLFRFRFHWKSAALLTLCCVALTATSYSLRVAEYVRDDTAVLVAAEVSLRSGDGSEFAEFTTLSSAEGRLVQVLDRRDSWVRIGLDGGTTGWIERAACEEI
jgi:hypothetical protein